MNVKNAILSLSDRIFSEYGFTVKLCGEIECLFEGCERVEDDVWQTLIGQAERDGVSLESIGREKTNHPSIQQYECRFKPTAPIDAATAIEWVKNRLSAQANFDAFHADSGLCNGLHWHLHLLNEEGIHVFVKQEEEMNPALSDVLGGLLMTMPDVMPCFAPNDTSYARIRSGADHVPTKICWGGNNRSVALRLPESVIPLRHIEHRVCGADADPYVSVWAVLFGVLHGLEHHPDPGEQMYGDANRPQYDLQPLPASLEVAKTALRESVLVSEEESAAFLDAATE